MDSSEIDISMYLAFRLGLRLAADSLGRELTVDDLAALLGQLFRVAGGEETRQDPTAFAAKFSDARQFAIDIGRGAIGCERELAQRILKGFEIDNAEDEDAV
jgi:hypothetical protein